MPTFTFSLGSIFELFLYVLLLVFVIHAMILIYHWFTFGTEHRVPTIATAVYLGVATVLFLILFLLTFTF